MNLESFKLKVNKSNKKAFEFNQGLVYGGMAFEEVTRLPRKPREPIRTD